MSNGRFVSLLSLGIAWLGIGSLHAETNVLCAHRGATDPTKEGFSANYYLGTPARLDALENDLGLPAWSITCPDNYSTQIGYFSGSLSACQQSQIANHGFTLTLVARVVQNYAPAFNAATPYIIGGASISATPGSRYDIDLAMDSSGNTVVVLPSIVVGVPGSTCAAPNTNLTVTVPGNDYHTYQLVLAPETALADLYIDGVNRIQGYSGTYCPGGMTGYGLAWYTANGGEAHYNLVQLNSTTIPAAFAGDFNGDCKVDLADFAAIASSWLVICASPSWCGGADIGQSGIVDLEDLLEFAPLWLVRY